MAYEPSSFIPTPRRDLGAPVNSPERASPIEDAFNRLNSRLDELHCVVTELEKRTQPARHGDPEPTPQPPEGKPPVCVSAMLEILQRSARLAEEAILRLRLILQTLEL